MERGRYGAGGNIAVNGGNVKAYSYYSGSAPSYGIGAGSGSSKANITLSWTNDTDSIFVNSYGGTVLLLKPFIDEELNYHNTSKMINGRSEINGDLNGKTLNPGEIHPTGDDGETDPEESIQPDDHIQTGDNNRTGLWFALIAVSMISLAALMASRRRYDLSAKRK